MLVFAMDRPLGYRAGNGGSSPRSGPLVPAADRVSASGQHWHGSGPTRHMLRWALIFLVAAIMTASFTLGDLREEWAWVVGVALPVLLVLFLLSLIRWHLRSH